MNIELDGIVDPLNYGKSVARVCWVLKEANNKGNGPLNIIDYLKRLPVNDRVPRRVALAVAVINGTKILDSLEYCKSQLLTISWININKEGGGSSSNYTKIKKAFEQNEGFLYSQIQEAMPEVVVFGGTFSFFWNSLLRRGCMMRKLEFKANMVRPRCYLDISGKYNFLFVEAYHPAYRRIKDFEYAYYVGEAVNAWKTGKWTLVSHW